MDAVSNLMEAPETFSSAARKVAFITRGHKLGPITRLVRPSGLGKRIKPFVLLNLFNVAPPNGFLVRWHPHSGIATLTLVMEGQASYEEATGALGVLKPGGGVEWMQAGGGSWHTAGVVGQERLRGFQLWVALPPELELKSASSLYIEPEQVPAVGPTRVVLGRYQGITGPIPAPSDMVCLYVRLAPGERWLFRTPESHSVAWLSVLDGQLSEPTNVGAGDVAIFEESSASVEVVARTQTLFVFGSARKHPYDLVLGRYSVHTTREALQRGELNIEQIGQSRSLQQRTLR
jgi:redox-sensitive bicupin YhaK (pirin superfamily)